MGDRAGWLAEIYYSSTAAISQNSCMQPGCLHAFRAACMHVNGIFSQPASQPARGPRPPDMARTVKMHWLPGARMAPPGARAQGAVAGDILGRVRARARVSRSKFHKIRAPQCHSAVKMGGRTVHTHTCTVHCSYVTFKTMMYRYVLYILSYCSCRIIGSY